MGGNSSNNCGKLSPTPFLIDELNFTCDRPFGHSGFHQSYALANFPKLSYSNQALMKDFENTYVCEICRIKTSRNFFLLEYENLCLNCNYWNSIIEKINPDFIFVESQQLFIDAGNDPLSGDKAILGTGTTISKIITKDNREILTNNLWFQGRIPSWFYDKFVNNCISIL